MTDRFRRAYVPLSKRNENSIRIIKDYAADIEEYLNVVHPNESSRELSLALTKLEEAVFWVTKHLSAPERQ